MAIFRLGDAERYADQYLALAQRMGDRRGIAHAYDLLGFAALMREDRDRAQQFLNAALTMSIAVGHTELAAHVVMDLAVLARDQQPAHAARLFGAGEVLRDEVGAAIWPSRRLTYDQSQAMVRDALGEAEFAHAWAHGRAMTPDGAVRYAWQPRPDL
jgi:hypothetical protein